MKTQKPEIEMQKADSNPNEKGSTYVKPKPEPTKEVFKNRFQRIENGLAYNIVKEQAKDKCKTGEFPYCDECKELKNCDFEKSFFSTFLVQQNPPQAEPKVKKVLIDTCATRPEYDDVVQ